MVVSEQVVAHVVAETSLGIGRAEYIQARVGEVIQAQQSLMRFVVAYKDELGVEGVVTTLFHTSVLLACAARATAKRMTALTMSDLDAGSRGAKDERELELRQPHLLGYLRANVDASEGDPARRATQGYVLRVIALALDNSLG